VLGRNVRVEGALIEDSILLDNCVVGPKVRIRKTILDESVTVPEAETIGYDLNRDQRCHHVTETGIVVVENVARSRGSEGEHF
jgi:glucose-1-phosphate adenylyltransferase